VTSDRDRSIEPALRASVRDRLATASSSDCLDADVLGAWADGTLERRARQHAETHAADCARCQALLAAMVATSPVPAADGRPWWRRSPAWLVPLSAAAAAVVLWVVVPQPDIGRPEQAAQVAVPAELKSEARAEPPSEAPEAPPASKVEALTAAQGQAAGALSRENRQQPSAAPSPAEADRAATFRQRDEAVAPAAPAEEAARMADQRADSALPLAGAPPAPPPGPAAPSAARAASAPGVAGGRLDVGSVASRELAEAVPTSREVIAPGSGVRWRLSGRSIQLSVDGGSTWEPLDVDPPADLAAGVAPSASVAWAVGRQGTVLRTTDGRRFDRVTFPEPVDLVQVSAVDARTATVTAVDGRTFRTADGGATWTR
jgi:hypothetical protein